MPGDEASWQNWGGKDRVRGCFMGRMLGWGCTLLSLPEPWERALPDPLPPVPKASLEPTYCGGARDGLRAGVRGALLRVGLRGRVQV